MLSFSGAVRSNSAVECNLPKVEVAGSIPVSRSNQLLQATVIKVATLSCRCRRGANSAGRLANRAIFGGLSFGHQPLTLPQSPFG